MTDQRTTQKTTIVGGEISRTTVSDEIASALKQANDRITRMDTDPIIRLALARVAVRTFAAGIVEKYADQLAPIADEFGAMAELLKTKSDLPEEIRMVLAEGGAAAPGRRACPPGARQRARSARDCGAFRAR